MRLRAAPLVRISTRLQKSYLHLVKLRMKRNVYFTKGSLEDTVTSLDSKAYTSYLPEGGYTEDQLKDLERGCSDESNNSLELDMEWDIINKEGTEFPPRLMISFQSSVSLLSARNRK